MKEEREKNKDLTKEKIDRWGWKGNTEWINEWASEKVIEKEIETESYIKERQPDRHTDIQA